MNLETLSAGFADLWESILANSWPTTFCANVLGIEASTGAVVHTWMELYLVVYGLCTASALTLHFFQKQKAVTGWVRKLADGGMTLIVIPLLQVLGSTVQMAVARIGAVEGSFSFSDDGVLWVWNVLKAIFAPFLLCVVVIALLAIPLSVAFEYFQRYKSAGVLWVVFDVGLVPAVLSAMALSMYYGDRCWYMVIVLCLLATLLGQTGNYINPRDERKKAAAAKK
ncbi:MAG: hypothetical protein LUF28_06670 [Clostridiales bacterium]|nr:hypothetical protein [Clostridiales bacterium]